MKASSSSPSELVRLPFEAQLEVIDRALASGADPRAWLEAAGGLPDADPLAHLLEGLAGAGRLGEILEALPPVLEALSDPSLMHVLERADRLGPGPLFEHLAAEAERALSEWPFGRLPALAALARWLSRRAPDRHARLARRADERAARGEAEARDLCFLSGARLAALAREPERAALVSRAIEEALDALARAPKSISQANAEELLARRVYAAPGHLFFELLQNADDAGATSFEVEVGERAIRIVHDGEPFSFADLVGLLSIGQTTKRAEQIGFFGVGFKSVYEITERPRVHSGALDFEIAHVSIPRAIAAGAESDRGDRTVLVLPYRDARDPAVLAAQAAAIPGETLLTLRGVRRLRVVGPRRSLEWRRSDEGSEVWLEGEVTRRYRVAREEVSPSLGRETGRAARSPVLVAARLAPDARSLEPTPGRSLFAFLPTAEPVGLRVLVHARFDVTLDRERIEHGSLWNEALLVAAGEALARLAESLSRDGIESLPILPAPSELAPTVASLGRALIGALAERAVLRAADGSWVTPRAARLLEPALAEALAAEDLGGGARALAPLAPRESEVAEALGAERLGAAALVRWMEATLVEGDPPPPWLGSAVHRALAEAEVEDETLRGLPLIVDAAGALVSAARARVGTAAFAALYAGVAPVVDAGTLRTLPSRLAARLALAPLAPETLVSDLAEGGARRTLLAREGRLLRALAELPPSLRARLDSIPILPTLGGERVSIASGLRRLAPELESIGSVLSPWVPILDAALEREHGALLRAWVPTFGVAELVAGLEAAHESLADETLSALERFLVASAESLSPALLRRLARLPIFSIRARGLLPPGGESRRPLVGVDRGLSPALDALPAALGEWPWLAFADEFAALAGAPRVDASALADALVGEPTMPAVRDADLPAALELLVRHADSLPARRVDALAVAPIWLDAEAHPTSLDQLRRGGGSEVVEAYFDSLDGRRLAHPISLSLASALRLEARLPSTDLGALVADLVRGEAPPADRELLAAALEEAVDGLSAAELAPLADASIFLDETGAPRPLGEWSLASPRASHRPGSFRAVLGAGALPLLAVDEERRFARLLERIGPRVADLEILVTRLEEEAALATPLGPLHEALVERRAAIDEALRERLARLPIFESRAGAVAAAVELTESSELDLLGAARVEALGLADALLAPESARVAQRLSLPTRAAGELIEARVLPRLERGAKLDAQPAPFDTLEALSALAHLLVGHSVDLTARPLWLDTSQVLVSPPVFDAGPATRRLVGRLAIRQRLIDEAWLAGAPDALRSSVETLPARVVAEALRAACPEERPIDGHPILPNERLLFDWIEEEAAAIEADEAALAALGAAAVVPSRRGTLRPPRSLVLDPSLPDLGLDWGLAPEVPPAMARWLAARFDLERAERGVLVGHLLDGLAAAERNDDAPRAASLVRFLARALGAGEVSAKELERRARRLDVRARLKVPLTRQGWAKPRRAWMPVDEVIESVEAFSQSPPDRVCLEGLDAPARALLEACGAAPDLERDAVVGLLDGEGLKPGVEARRALARYVLERAAREPGLVGAFSLAERAFVLDGAGVLRRPGELLWPDALGRAFFQAAHALPDPQVISGLASDAGPRLGFRLAASLSLPELARFAEGAEAGPALLEWIEEGLREKRFRAPEVREALRDALLLRDDEGVLRPVSALAGEGARALFGRRRGDTRLRASFPRACRALGVPARPDAAMMIDFVEEAGRALDSLDEAARRSLTLHMPEVWRRLADLAASGTQVQLGPEAALAVVRAGTLGLARLGDPSLRRLDPAELRDALSTEQYRELSVPEPPEPAVGELLGSLGVKDLLSDLARRGLRLGPLRPDLDARAEALRLELAAFLGDAAGRGARVADALSLEGVVGGSERGYRGAPAPVSVAVDAALDEGVLWMTPTALEDPSRLAPALADDPARRHALRLWLEAGEWRAPPPKWRRREEGDEREKEAPGFWGRLKGIFGRERERPRPPPKPSRRSDDGEPVRLDPGGDEGHFRARDELRSQLEGTEGWLERRLDAPAFGFAFSPERLPAPWIYAPNLVAVRFEPGTQRWRASAMERPRGEGEVGAVSLRGRLPAGEVLLPAPHYGRLTALEVGGERRKAVHLEGRTGALAIRLDGPAEVRLRFALGAVPHLERATVAPIEEALSVFVPDAELPEEALDFVADLEGSAFERALEVRDFVRRRYRYDPSYLEDPSVGRWLARVTMGRAHAHVAALHAGRDARHLGAGVCYELNSLACELMRRAGVPAALATGWVYDGGHLSEPDHLWALALLVDASGAPVWMPIDASTTRDGRPLRVPRRAAGRFRAPKEEKKAPKPPQWADTPSRGRGRRGASGSVGAAERPKREKKRRSPPRAELLKVLHHLERLSGRKLEPSERESLTHALEDGEEAAALLERLRD